MPHQNLIKMDEQTKPKEFITLAMPIKIRPTVKCDGYVITDVDDVEHFFYYKSMDMVYDGSCMPVKRMPKRKKSSK